MDIDQWLTFALLSCSLNAFAELPLNIEDLMADQGRYKLDLSANYANTERQGVTASDPIIVQTGPTSFIILPTKIGETQSNADTFVGTVGLRYGFTHNTEFIARTSFIPDSCLSD